MRLPGTLFNRRQAALLAAGVCLPSWAVEPRQLRFPTDHGSHNGHRTEWWYITGLLADKPLAPPQFGFQVTFFRSRLAANANMASPLAAKHVLFAHAAVSHLARGELLHAEQLARYNGQFEAQAPIAASETDTELRLRSWHLRRRASGYATQVRTDAFALQLQLTPTQALLLQGNNGLSRKGPDATQASHYYSQPQLATAGTLRLGSRELRLQGKAWLDHEWSQQIMHPDAVGWDWIGMNLADGSALTAFQLRPAKPGAAPIWAGGSFRSASGRLSIYSSQDLRFEPVPGQVFTSASTSARYPTHWHVHTPQGRYTVQALLPNQELDNRGTTGTVYWEGASALLDAQGAVVGHGYLEMTGYAGPIRL